MDQQNVPVTLREGYTVRCPDTAQAVLKNDAGTKYDADKPRTDLLDPDALIGIAHVLSFGARKYAAHNWRKGISWSRLLGAILRHTFALMRGEDVDPESGLPHVDHLGCCWMFLSWHMKNRPDLDDRWTQEDLR
jgi:hypothetical protein